MAAEADELDRIRAARELAADLRNLIVIKKVENSLLLMYAI